MALHAFETILKSTFACMHMKCVRKMDHCNNNNVFRYNLNAKSVRKNYRNSFCNDEMLIYLDGLVAMTCRNY